MPVRGAPLLNLFTLFRAIAYAALFISLVLVFLPAQVLRWAGVERPAVIGAPQIVGIVLMILGGALAIWCVLAFATLGRGTPAPFDPPRLLVVRGPYRYVRNPMYIGAAVALAGASLFYESIALAGFTILFLLIVHSFVMLYEERVLRRQFGADYDDYCARVSRWKPSAVTRRDTV
jgi:protein-S-isoprenylcysteine O-methyltransferase Ste14